MLAANRHEEILKMIKNNRYVKVSELSKIFDVSEETVRRDLDKLQSSGLLRKLHGGAAPVDAPKVENVKPIIERIEQNLSEKRVIANLAYEMIENKDTIILDSGSTTFQLAKILDKKVLTVITNDINIAYTLSTKQNIRLIITGGTLTQKSFAMVGPECEKYLKNLNVKKLFLATSGIKPDQGLTASNSLDAAVKRTMIEASEKVICLADSSKFGKAALITFALFSDIDTLITDHITDDSYIDYLKDKGVELITPQGKI